MEWLSQQWNKPDRHDHYVMKLIHYTSRSTASTLKDFAINFLPLKWRPKISKQQEADKKLAFSKGVWRAASRQSFGEVREGVPQDGE